MSEIERSSSRTDEPVPEYYQDLEMISEMVHEAAEEKRRQEKLGKSFMKYWEGMSDPDDGSWL